MTTTVKKKSFDKTIIHAIVITVIILGFGHLPTFSTVTPYGMKALGLFIGIIYGWLFAGMVTTSLLAFILTPFTGITTANGFLMSGFGNIVTLQVLFVIMLFAVMNTTEIPLKITNSLLGSKICQGKPWIFFGILMFATWLVSFIAGGVIPLFIVFPIVISLCEEYNIERYSKTSTMLFMGVLLADCIGQMCMPIKGMPIILMSLYQTVDPTAVFPLGIYMIYTTLLTLFILIVGLLSMKYLMRVDLGMLEHIDTSKYRGDQNKFTKRESYILVILITVLVLMVLQSIFPVAAIRDFMGQFGMVGFVLVGIMAVLLIKVDGTPLSTMKDLANGVQWDVILCVASMNPAMGFLSSDEAGIKEMLSAVCGPFISGLSPLAFVLMVIIICGVLTNFLNNQACCLMFYPIIMIYAPQLGINAVALVCAMIIISHVAFATPAASFYSLITFGYTDWIKSSVFMKYAFILLVPVLLSSALFGYALFFLF